MIHLHRCLFTKLIIRHVFIPCQAAGCKVALTQFGDHMHFSGFETLLTYLKRMRMCWRGVVHNLPEPIKQCLTICSGRSQPIDIALNFSPSCAAAVAVEGCLAKTLEPTNPK